MNCYYNFNEFDFLGNSAVTIGMFDGVHIGHQSVLNETVRIAKLHAWSSTVITFSNSPNTFFNTLSSEKYICSLSEKLDLFANLNIDNVIIVPFDHFIAHIDATDFFNTILLSKCRIKALILGYDNHFGKNREGSIQFVKINFPEIIAVSIEPQKIRGETISSTLIKKYIAEGNILKANVYLGRDFSCTGTVVKGKQLGRKLGFPTANLKLLDNHSITLGNGVYACYLFIGDIKYYGLVNIGVRPTVDDNTNISIEAYILNFEDDIYDQELKIYFLEKRRDEKKFDNISLLVDQINSDVNDVRAKYLV